MSRPTMTLETFCELHKITADVTYGGQEPGDDDWKRTAHPWTVTLKRGRRRLTTPFWTGSALTDDPTAADVLGSLLLDASSVDGRDFDDWCEDYIDVSPSPYGTADRRTASAIVAEVRRAERCYAACRALLPKLRAFLGDLYDAASAAEH